MKSGDQFISGREEEGGRAHVITDVAVEFAYAEETVIQQSIICGIVQTLRPCAACKAKRNQTEECYLSHRFWKVIPPEMDTRTLLK